MPTATHASMHQNHRQWLSDNKMWRCDIAAWQQEFKTVTQELKQVEAALMEHEQALQIHAAAIRVREQDLTAHEHALAEYERGEAGDQLIALARAHDQEAAKHAQQSEAHERIKRHHHLVMAKVVELRKSLAKALSRTAGLTLLLSRSARDRFCLFHEGDQSHAASKASIQSFAESDGHSRMITAPPRIAPPKTKMVRGANCR